MIEHGHVLWVEPGERDLTEVKTRLLSAQYRLGRAQTLAGALELMTSLPIAVVVLHLDLADAQGLSAIKILRRHAPYVPLVVLMDSESTCSFSEVLRAGAEEILGRNAVSAVVLRALRHAIDRARWSAQTRQLLRVHPDPALVVDDTHIVRFANGPAERLFGATIVGQELPIDAPQGVRRTHLPPALGGGSAEVRVVEMTWQGEQLHVVTVRELGMGSTRLEDPELQHLGRLASIGALTVGVTHEVNNVATGALADLALLGHRLAEINMSEATRSELRTNIRECTLGVKQMSSMLAEIGGFARLEVDDVTLVDVNNVVNTACSWIRRRLDGQSRLVKTLREVPLIMGHEIELRQVLVNLLMNAVHAIEAKSGDENRIMVETGSDRDKLVISVRDTGPGVPEDLKARIFDPFFTTKPRGQGTGLGLSLSGEIVKKHGGNIEVESSGSGACFKIVLPHQTPLRTS